MKRAPIIEQRVRQALEHLPGVVEVRGKGAMLGLQLQSYAQTMAVVEACMKEHILLGWTLHSNTLVRLAPPLTISDEVLDETLAVLVQSIQQTPYE